MWRTTTCDERIQMCDESGQDTSNTPPSCPDKGKGKKREEQGRKKGKEQGGVLMFREWDNTKGRTMLGECQKQEWFREDVGCGDPGCFECTILYLLTDEMVMNINMFGL